MGSAKFPTLTATHTTTTRSPSDVNVYNLIIVSLRVYCPCEPSIITATNRSWQQLYYCHHYYYYITIIIIITIGFTEFFQSGVIDSASRLLFTLDCTLFALGVAVLLDWFFSLLLVVLLNCSFIHSHIIFNWINICFVFTFSYKMIVVCVCVFFQGHHTPRLQNGALNFSIKNVIIYVFNI